MVSLRSTVHSERVRAPSIARCGPARNVTALPTLCPCPMSIERPGIWMIVSRGTGARVGCVWRAATTSRSPGWCASGRPQALPSQIERERHSKLRQRRRWFIPSSNAPNIPVRGQALLACREMLLVGYLSTRFTWNRASPRQCWKLGGIHEPVNGTPSIRSN